MSLSPREQVVLKAIAEGKTNREIAEQLGRSVKTIETQRQSIRVKLDTKGTANFVIAALRLGLIEIPPDFGCRIGRSVNA